GFLKLSALQRPADQWAEYGQAEQGDRVYGGHGHSLQKKGPPCHQKRLSGGSDQSVWCLFLWGKHPFHGDPLHPHHGTLTA
ncbi:hypothetical protein JKG47_10750, partial [Acidithiobacillus sp. MC6.1]|nr:hypothetical protein [Acidithiobacillus sp. MC6.1]